jgi:uncharacterized protein (DUF305 family)
MSTVLGSPDALRRDAQDHLDTRGQNLPLWSAVAALMVLALLAGLGAGWWSWGRTPAEGSPEVTFARDMSAHHDQAVEMAVIMRDRTTDPALRTVMMDMILTQQNQIGQMSGWLTLWGRPMVNGTPMDGHGAMMGMATQEQVNVLGTLPIAEAEVSFLKLMIAHHLGGVAMANDALAETTRPEVVRLAESIVAAQQSEVTLMEDMLKQRGAEVPATTPMPADEHQGHE